MLSLLLLIACQDAETLQVQGPQHGAPPTRGGGVGIEAQAGEQHPPIPGDNPGWIGITDDFKNAPMAYGEERWDDVTMRVLGHYAQASRDLARLHVQMGSLEDAKLSYEGLAERLTALDLGEEGQSREIRQLHVQAAQAHAQLIALRLSEEAVPQEGLGPNATDRWRVASGLPPLEDAPRPWADLRIDDFEDFRDRHRLRLEMNRFWLDSVDPEHFSDPWGYWRPEAADATAEALRKGVPASTILKASYPNQIHSGELGRLPTGDLYLDTAGGAGPMSIGKLAVLGLDDPEHRSRLEGWAETLNGVLKDDPDAFVAAIESYVKELETYTHGSRFYNIKQLINTGTRHLARAEHFDHALLVFKMHRPLHSQDWLCPNRMGIQLGIEGRLTALTGNQEEAKRLLLAAIKEAEDWLMKINHAKTQGPPGPPGPPRPGSPPAP